MRIILTFHDVLLWTILIEKCTIQTVPAEFNFSQRISVIIPLLYVFSLGVSLTIHCFGNSAVWTTWWRDNTSHLYIATIHSYKVGNFDNLVILLVCITYSRQNCLLLVQSESCFRTGLVSDNINGILFVCFILVDMDKTNFINVTETGQEL